MSLFLSRQELEEMTGYKISAKQQQWLRKEGINFAVAKSGKPKVMRSAVYDKFGASNEGYEEQPNFEALS